jgi:hypothetical protein
MSHPRSRLLKFSLLLFAVLLFIFITGVFVAGRNRPQLPQITLTDGRTVQLVAVTVGPTHSLRSPALRDFFFHFMPPGLKKQMGPTYNSSFGFQYNGIALWLMCYDPALEQYVPGVIDKIVVIDSHGCELESTGSGATSDGIHHASVINLSNFPRDLDRITCQLFAANSSNALGQITITNPVKTASVQWSPNPLPVAVTNGDIAVRLDRLPRKNFTAEYAVFKNGRPTKEWSLQQSHFEDAFGNAGPNLCRKQSAWKFKTRFSRNETASFASNEVWRLPSVQLPAPGACVTLNLSNTIGSNEVIVRHLIGPGSYSFSNGVFLAATAWTNGMNGQFGVTWKKGSGRNYLPVTTRVANETTLLVFPHSLLWPREMFIRAWYEDRLVAVSRSGSGDGSSTYFNFNWLVPTEEIPSANTPLDIEVIMQTGLEFDFLVAPEDAIDTTEITR